MARKDDPEYKKRATANWNKENIRIVACNVRKEKKEAFQKACAEAGTTPNAVLLAAVDSFLDQHPVKKDSPEN